jgi:antirestriction protein ArdC
VIEKIPVRYELSVNMNGQSTEAQYATIVHELAHLYCGHLGSTDVRFWPNRWALEDATMEFEAESLSFMVCARMEIETKSAEYLSGYVKLT